MIDDIRRLARLQGCAAALVQDENFRGILTVLKERAIREWAGSDPGDADHRELAYADMRAVGRLESYLRELVDGKSMTERKIDAQERKSRQG